MNQPSLSVSKSGSAEQGTNCVQTVGLLLHVLTFVTLNLFNKKRIRKKKDDQRFYFVQLGDRPLLLYCELINRC